MVVRRSIRPYMSTAIPPPTFPWRPAAPVDSTLPVSELVLDELSEALLHVSSGADLVNREGVPERFIALRPRMAHVYDLLNALMKELSD